MTTPHKILITGAAGNLGRKLSRHLQGKYDLVLLDRVQESGVMVADLSVWDEGWTRTFTGVDTVVHLAGNPIAYHDWSELIGPNVDAVLNVFEASAGAGVKRVIFASSNHVMGGYQSDPDIRITPQLPPLPGLQYTSEGQQRNSFAYAASKLFGERLGNHYAGVHGMTVVSIRIGWVWRGVNEPASLPPDRGVWFRQMWLSDRDYLQLMDCAITADLPTQHYVVNGMSRNTGMPWDLTDTCTLLGYQPVDDVHQSRGG